MRRQPQHWLLLALAFCTLLLPACQDASTRVYPVTGRVVFVDGSAAQFGSIECRSDTAEPVIARGKINQDGTFQLKSFGTKNGLIAGMHTVIIQQILGSHRDGGTVLHHHSDEIAKKYSSYETTDIKVEVAADGKNHFELVVEANSAKQ